MCELIGKAQQLALTRRGLITRATAVTGSAAAYGALGGVEAAAGPPHDGGQVARWAERASHYRTRLVLLGTAGGPVWQPGGREGIASALVVGDAVYVIDCGDAVGHQYRKAGLGGSVTTGIPVGFERLRAIFLTHLHSDHTIDYFNLYLFAWAQGLEASPTPVQVYGPGNRGALPPIFGPAPPPPVINPDNPTPGTVEMTDYLYQAFSNDMNDRMRDNRRRDLRTLVEPHDIPLPAELTADPNGNPHPPMDPVPVHEDDNVKVTATLVFHPPMFPSFAFRFDTDDGSVVFSGDTGPSANLVRLAMDADILVHEVIDRDWAEGLFGPPPLTDAEQGLLEHLVKTHTAIEEVGPIADEAGATTLVLNHLVPANDPAHRFRRAQRNFSGRLIVGEDLMQLGVGRRQRARRAS